MCGGGGVGTKGREEAELFQQIKTLDFQDGRTGGPQTPMLPLNAFPRFRGRCRGRALVFSASAWNSSNWKEEGRTAVPRAELPPAPRKVQKRPREKSAASVADVEGGQRSRPPGRGAELARTGAGMARRLSFGELTPRSRLPPSLTALTCPAAGPDTAAARAAAPPSPALGKARQRGSVRPAPSAHGR